MPDSYSPDRHNTDEPSCPPEVQDTRSSVPPRLDGFRAAEITINGISVLIWPLILVFAMVYFGADLKALLARSNKQTLKTPIGEFTLEEQQSKAEQLLASATVYRPITTEEKGKKPEIQPVPLNAAKTTSTVKEIVTQSTLAQFIGKRILWVDDHPENNVYETQLFQSLGMSVDPTTSTDGALEMLSHNKYAVVITDMRRGDDYTAGYELLESMRQKGIRVPLIIYSSSSNAQFQAQALSKGASGETNDPTELLKLVSAAIQK